ncbi:MAG: ABC transporter substrate-binding protein [Enterococcus sp.]|nr:ABC transporter substrate-binding protein [Enterococcus sp.]
MKRILIGFSAVLLLTLSACGSETKKLESQTETSKQVETISESFTPLKIGVMPSMDNIPLIIAHEQGFDKDHGVELQIEAFKSGKDRDAAFQAGAVDGINADLISFATYLQGGMDVKITSATQGQFDFIGAKEIQSVADLKGKEVVILKNQGPEFVAEKFLEQAGLQTSEVQMVEVPQVPARVELLTNDQASAAVLPEPFVTMTVTQGMHNLGSTLDLGINLFALTFPQAIIDEKAAAIKGMYEAYNDAVDWMNTHEQSEYLQLFIDEIGFPETLKDQINVPTYQKAFQTKETDIKEAFAWAVEKGLLEKEIEPKDVLSNVYFQ